MLDGPIARAFLALIARDGLAPADVGTPPQAFRYAAAALETHGPWMPPSPRMRLSMNAGVDLDALAADVAAAAPPWWTQPFDPNAQVLCVDPHVPQDRGISGSPWEPYSQRPAGWRVSSTRIDGVSCVEVVVAAGIGDWPQPSELARFEVQVDPAVRIYEVRNPEDWHVLCCEFPAVTRDTSSPAGAGSLSPDWRRVRERWDGVHLSFLGLLTTPFVRTTSGAGTSMLWSWDAEMTMWLRSEALRIGAQLPTLNLEVPYVAPLAIDVPGDTGRRRYYFGLS